MYFDLLKRCLLNAAYLNDEVRLLYLRARLGGFEPQFRSPGGGLVNHDFRDRALTLTGLATVVLLGEGVFHQFHGGVVTNVAMQNHPGPSFREEYRTLRGTDYRAGSSPEAVYFGTLPPQALRFLGQPGRTRVLP